MDHKNWIAILDFGSQYTQLIARRIREQKVYSEIIRYNTPAAELARRQPSGIILSGGPSSVFEPGAPLADPAIYDLGIPILGIVENMSIHICSKCGHEEHIFGSGGAEKMGKDYEVEVLGHLPLDINIRMQVDGGKPTVVADPDGRVAEIYKGIARRVAIKIAEKAKDMTSKFPNIVIQNT